MGNRDLNPSDKLKELAKNALADGLDTTMQKGVIALESRPELVSDICDQLEIILEDTAKSGGHLARFEFKVSEKRNPFKELLSKPQYEKEGNEILPGVWYVKTTIDYNMIVVKNFSFEAIGRKTRLDEIPIEFSKALMNLCACELEDRGYEIEDRYNSNLGDSTFWINWMSDNDANAIKQAAKMPKGRIAMKEGVPPEDIIA